MKWFILKVSNPTPLKFSPEFEITIDELISNWKKTNKIIFEENIGTRLDLGEEFDNYVKKLTLFK